MTEKICGVNSVGDTLCKDMFLSQFISMHKANDHGIQSSLVTLLLKALVSKMMGKRNVMYDDNVRNFLALATSSNKQAFVFYQQPRSVYDFTPWKRYIAKHRPSSLIDFEDNKVIMLIQNAIEIVCHKFNDPNSQVVFTG